MANEQLYSNYNQLVKFSTSVIMVTYKTGPILFESIESVLLIEHVKELIIVNNGNPTHVVERLEALNSNNERIKLIHNKKNIGYTKAINIGARQASGYYILLLNPDCILPRQPKMLEQMIKVIEFNEDSFMGGCPIFNPNGTEQSGSRRNFLNPGNALVEVLGLHEFTPLPPHNLHNTPLPKDIIFIPVISGAFMLIQRNKFSQMGGLDERYFMHVDDVDFCMRVFERGFKIIFFPEYKIIHQGSSSKISSIFIEWHKMRGFIIYMHKFFSRKLNAIILWLVYFGIVVRFLVKSLLVNPAKFLLNLFSNKS